MKGIRMCTVLGSLLMVGISFPVKHHGLIAAAVVTA